MLLDIFKKKEKVIDPIIHEDEENISITSGVHILSNCRNVLIGGNAIVLECISTTVKEIYGRAFVQIFEDGTVGLVSGRAIIVLLKSGFI